MIWLTTCTAPAGYGVRNYAGAVAAAQPAEHRNTPDISQLSPQLQQQWDHAANAHLGNIVITPFSGRKVQWMCDGHLHIWLATVHIRSNGRGCPFCSGHTVCKHNSLPTKAPLIAAQWHPTMNMIQPEDVTASSGRKAYWLCPACNHTWVAGVGHRVSGYGCPQCNGNVGKHKYKRRPTFAACKHPLLAEWDHRRNAEAGHSPERVTLASKKQISWLCPNCPAGQEHSYCARPDLRTRSRLPSGCPYCAGKKACKCNSLSTHYPDLALKWDYGKNEGTPEDHTAHSEDIVWWLSEQGSSWQQPIKERTSNVDHSQRKRRLHPAQ